MISEEEFKHILARNIKIERVKKDLTQEKLSELAEICEKHITTIENRKVLPSIYIIRKIADALGVTVDKLVYKHED